MKHILILLFSFLFTGCEKKDSNPRIFSYDSHDFLVEYSTLGTQSGKSEISEIKIYGSLGSVVTKLKINKLMFVNASPKEFNINAKDFFFSLDSLKKDGTIKTDTLKLEMGKIKVSNTSIETMNNGFTLKDKLNKNYFLEINIKFKK